MEVFSSYSVRISTSQCCAVFEDTTAHYRAAVDFFIGVMLEHWGAEFKAQMGTQQCIAKTESLCCPTARRPSVLHDFSQKFYKFPSYLRRAAIQCAYGKVSAYKSLLEAWEKNPLGNPPGQPVAGKAFPPLYRKNMFVRSDNYRARIKVFVRNTWDWIEVPLRKGDVDYINRHCTGQKEHVPSLCRRGKIWSLDFPFSMEVGLTTKDIFHQTIVSVDLGYNNACVCTVMRADGTVMRADNTVIGRYFLKLPNEKDSLNRALGSIRKAQKHGAKKMPRLWARAKGINNSIAVKTAQFIIDIAKEHNADVIVMERLDFSGRGIRGKRYRQKLHLWKARYIQRLVEHKAHQNGMRFSRVCAWNTSRLAYDGSGAVERDAANRSMCKFKTGKRYHCDLSAAYNIGARYFIRAILQSLPAKVGQCILAKVPECMYRSTCTLSSLIRMCAELWEISPDTFRGVKPHSSEYIPYLSWA